MNTKKIKFDSANVVLSNNVKTDKIILNVEVELQDVPFNVTHVGDADSTGINQYNPVLGGFEQNLNFVSEPTTWTHQSTQGKIPTPTFQVLGNKFIVADPTNPNPQVVDQNGLVPKMFHFMEVQVEPVYVQFESTKSDGEQSVFQQSNTLLSGYVAKFEDSVNHQIHTVFIDATMATNIQQAITQAQQKILDVSNWDKATGAPTLVNYAEQNHLAFEKLGDNREDTQVGVLDFKDETTFRNNKIEIEFDQNGNFLRIVGLQSGDLTHIVAQEITKSNGEKQIFVEFNQNPQLAFHTNGDRREQDLAAHLNWNAFNDPVLNTIRQKIIAAGFSPDELYGLEMFKEVADKGVSLNDVAHTPAPVHSAPIAPQHFFEPKIKGPNGLEITLTPTEFNSYLKAMLVSVYRAHINSPLYDFIEQLSFTFDPLTGDVSYTDNSNGNFGWKIDDAQSRFNFANNHNGFEIFLSEKEDKVFETQIDLTVKSQEGATTEQLGHINFDQNKNDWTAGTITLNNGVTEPGMSTSTILTQHGSSLVFQSNGNTNQLVMTTDGTFKPVDGNGITWTQDSNNPNIWIGVGTTPEFTNTMPTTSNNIHVVVETIKKDVAINIETKDTLTNRVIQTSQTVQLVHDLFTNTFKPVSTQPQDLLLFNVLNHQVVTNLELTPQNVGLDNYVKQTIGENLIDKTKTTFGPEFIYLTTHSDYTNPNLPVVTIVVGTAMTKSNPQGNGQTHKITVNIKDTKGDLIETAVIVQDPVTKNILLEDLNGKPLTLSTHIQTQIFDILNGMVATGFDLSLQGKSSRQYNFVNVTYIDENGNKVTKTLSGDAYSSTI